MRRLITESYFKTIGLRSLRIKIETPRSSGPETRHESGEEVRREGLEVPTHVEGTRKGEVH